MAAKTIKLIILPIIQNSEKMKFTDQSKNMIIDKLQGRSHWGAHGGHVPLPHLNFRTKQGPQILVSNIWGIAF